MNAPICFVVLTEPGTVAEARVRSVAAMLTSRHGWTTDGDHTIAVVGATTMAAATALMAQLPATMLANTFVLGIDEGRIAGPNGQLWEFLENWRIAGAVSGPAMTSWEPEFSGFVGRKDLMALVNTSLMKDSQSRNYAAWVSTPGADLAEFLAHLVQAMVA